MTVAASAMDAAAEVARSGVIAADRSAGVVRACLIRAHCVWSFSA
jgi:hypothetical protein